ncbi:hypothetical protein BKA12_001654 [Neomicrococcus lactis]|uniref:Uncharacterized protein n=2 Tax=Neomicrococcus lactis TaxID=732241 RepID=A0A7W8YBM0_9MICC|nr:hypothetical protein [Neomicrococcus lactis]
MRRGSTALAGGVTMLETRSTRVSAWTRLNLLANLRIAQIANSLNIPWSIRLLRRIVMVFLASCVVVLPLVGFAMTKFLAALSTPQEAGELSVFVVVLFALWGMLAAGFAELLGKYRESISHNPNRAFYRSLGVSAAMLHGITAAPRIFSPLLFWSLMGTGVAAALGTAGTASTTPLVAALSAAMALVLVMAVAILGASVRVARRQNAGKTPVVGGALLFGAAGLGAGVVATIVISRFVVTVGGHALLPANTSISERLDTLPAAAWWVFSGLLLALLVAATVWVARGYQLLHARSFALNSGAASAHDLGRDHVVHATRSAGEQRCREASWVRSVWRQRGGSWRLKVEVRILWGFAFALGLLAVLTATFASEPIITSISMGQGHICAIAVLAGALLGVGIAESTLGDIGPVVLRGQLRAAVELGVPATRLAHLHALVLGAPAFVFGALALSAGALVAVLFRGALAETPVVTAVIPLLAGLGVLAGFAASVIAERLFPPPRAVDGTSNEGLATAIVSLLLAAVPALWHFVFSATLLATALTFLTVLTLVGGAWWCIRRNLTHLSN